MRIGILLVLVAALPCVVGGQISWDKHVLSSEFNGAVGVYSIDLDNDGDIDIIGTSKLNDTIMWWENISNGFDWDPHIIDQSFDGAHSVYSADIDGDSDLDVVGAAYSAGTYAWWENLGGAQSWSQHLISSGHYGAISVCVADINDDGDNDVIGAARYENDICYWENENGDGSQWEQYTLDNNYLGAFCVHSIDIDNDNDNDILTAGLDEDVITWWENIGNENWIEHVIGDNYDGAHWVNAGDIDNDGDIDIVGAAVFSDMLTWWENENFGDQWIEHTITDNFNGASCIIIDYVDSDNNIDIVGAAEYANEVSWWKSIENGSDWIKYTIDDEFDFAYAVTSGDLDADGDTDIIGTAHDGNEIAYWEQKGSYLTIEIEPFGVPVVVPPAGGFIDFEVRIINTSGDLVWFSAWTTAELPNGNLISPVLLYNYLGIQAYSGWVTVASQGVPGFAPAGEYIYSASVGTFPTLTLSTDSFVFNKTGVAAYTGSAVYTWVGTGDWSQAGTGTATSHAPSRYSITPSYPNPFNPSTTVAVSLPEASELTVSVFNVTGQQVAELANGQFTAGQHNLTFDAQGLASGLYFIHATVPGQLNQVQKVMLVR
ncbi:T9SS type A sorting domain-containing protein [bacterium]|nr:T9SS type A sorting domain-containing protein [bacterium]